MVKAERRREWSAANAEAQNARRRELYAANSERERERSRLYYRNNRDGRQQYYHENRDRKLAYYRENRDRILAQATAARGGGALRCRWCKEPTGSKYQYCAECRPQYLIYIKRKSWNRRPRVKSTSDRGYGVAHNRLRARWAPRVATGTVRCWRPECGQLIAPGEAWHLGHDDHDRSKYRGPEHARCNMLAAAREGRRRQREKKLANKVNWSSRSW